MNTTISINSQMLAAANLCVAKNDVRYYLQGIYFEKADDGGVIICATNGHYLFAGLDKNGTIDNAPEQDLIVELPRAIQSSLKKAKIAVIETSGESGPNGTELARITAGAVSHECHLVDARFPDWRAVTYPNDPEGLPQSFDPALFRVICQAAEIMGRCVSLSPTGKDKALNIDMNGVGPKRKTDTDDCEAFAILMPRRTDAEFKALPNWTRKAHKLVAVA